MYKCCCVVYWLLKPDIYELNLPLFLFSNSDFHLNFSFQMYRLNPKLFSKFFQSMINPLKIRLWCFSWLCCKPRWLKLSFFKIWIYYPSNSFCCRRVIGWKVWWLYWKLFYFLLNLQTAQAKLTGDHIYCTNERERLPQIRIHKQKEGKKHQL